jgi:hypothetical protein
MNGTGPSPAWPDLDHDGWPMEVASEFKTIRIWRTSSHACHQEFSEGLSGKCPDCFRIPGFIRWVHKRGKGGRKGAGHPWGDGWPGTGGTQVTNGELRRECALSPSAFIASGRRVGAYIFREYCAGHSRQLSRRQDSGRWFREGTSDSLCA